MPAAAAAPARLRKPIETGNCFTDMASRHDGSRGKAGHPGRRAGRRSCSWR
jgi:hypothetical protein